MSERFNPKIVVTGAVLAGSVGGLIVSVEGAAADSNDELQQFGGTSSLKELPATELLTHSSVEVRTSVGVQNQAQELLANRAMITTYPSVATRQKAELTLPQQIGLKASEVGKGLLRDINAGLNDLLGKPQIPESLRAPKQEAQSEGLRHSAQPEPFGPEISFTGGMLIERLPDGTIRINIGSSDNKAQEAVESDEVATHNEAASEDILNRPVVQIEHSVPQTGMSYKQYLHERPTAPTQATWRQIKEQTDGIQDQHEKVAARMGMYKEHAEWLFSSFTPTRAGYEAFVRSGINQDYTDVFGNKRPLDRNKTIDPSCTVVHWMAGRPDSVEDFAAQMTHNVQAALMPGGRLYQVAPEINSLTWHAAGANNRCVGIEVWGFDSLDWDPAMAETLTYWLMYLHDTYDIPFERNIEAIERTPLDIYGDYTPTLEMLGRDYGHKEVDRLIATNSVGKIDPSTFTMNLLYKKVLELNSILEAAPSVPEDGRQGTDGGILDAPIVEDTDGYPSKPEGVAIEFSEQVEALLSSTARNYVVRTPEEALELSAQAKRNDGNLSDEEAFGPRLTPGDVYIYHRMAGFTREQAWIMTAIAGRESSWRPGAVGDIASGRPSYGMNQIRYLGVEGGPPRDPRANLDPRLAAINAYELYKQAGFEPWESYGLSGELTVENVFEAVRLAHRNNSIDWERNVLHHIEEMFRELPAIEAQFEARVGVST